jgi:hypothetical protein
VADAHAFRLLVAAKATFAATTLPSTLPLRDAPDAVAA